MSSGMWSQVATGEEAATVASGLANAGYFGRRVRLNRHSRRIAALVLAVLCAGSAAEALALWLSNATGGPAEAALALPLLGGNLAILWILRSGGRR